MADIKKLHDPGCKGSDCECPWRLDYRPLGVRGPRRRLLFKTRKEAERYLTETAHKASRGEYVDPAKIPTFAEVAEEWLRSKSDRRPGTVANWRAQIDHYLIPAFGRLRLDQIGVSGVEHLLDQVKEKPQNDARDGGLSPLERASGVADIEVKGKLSSRSVNALLTTLRSIFNLAIRRNWCAISPAARAEKTFEGVREIAPNGDSRHGHNDDDAVSADEVLDPSEVRRLIEAAEPGLHRTLFLVAALTGLRSGELFGLTWSCLELPKEGRGKVFVRRTLSWARVCGESEVKPRFWPPKTKNGKRTVPLPVELVAVLRVWKLRCPRSEHDLVFPTKDGRPMHRSNALKSGLRPALRRAGLRRVSMHSLRHSFASGLIMGGAPITEVQSLLGHSSPNVTLKVYSHWFRNVETGSVDRFAEAVLGGGELKRRREWAVSGHSEARSPRKDRVSI